jgi:hypothetical protein
MRAIGQSERALERCAAARCRARRSASRWPSSAPTTTSSPRAA